jgi:hypothetical protein
MQKLSSLSAEPVRAVEKEPHKTAKKLVKKAKKKAIAGR